MSVNRADRRPPTPAPTAPPTAAPASRPASSQAAAPAAAATPTQAPARPAPTPTQAPARPTDGFAASGDRRFTASSSATAPPPPPPPPAQATALRNQAASAEIAGFRATSSPSPTSGASSTSAAASTGSGITTLGNAAASAKLKNSGLSPADTQKALKEFDQLPASYQAKLLGDSKVSPQDLGKMLVAQSDMRAFSADPKNAARMAGVAPWPGARNIDTKDKFNQVLTEEGLSPKVKTEFMNKTLEKLKADPSLNASKAMMDVVGADPAKFRGQGPKIDPVEIDKMGGLGRAFGLKNLVDKNLTDPAKDFFRQYALANGLKADASVTDTKKQGDALSLSGMQLALKNSNGDLGKVMQQSGLPQDKFFKGTLSGYGETPAWTYPQNQLPKDPSQITPDVLKNKLALGDAVFKDGAVVINIPPAQAKNMDLTKPTALDGIALPEWAPTDPKNAWGMTKPLDPSKNPPCPEGMLKPVDFGSSIDLGKTRVYFQ